MWQLWFTSSGLILWVIRNKPKLTKKWWLLTFEFLHKFMNYSSKILISTLTSIHKYQNKQLGPILKLHQI